MAGYDAIVIGGGVVGLSTAYHLAQGGARTLLVDRGHAGRATDAGAGILSARPDIAAEDPCERFAAQAVRYYPLLIERLAAEGAGDTGHGVCGSLTVAVSDEELAALEQVRVGLRPASPGGLPILGPARGLANLHIATGHGAVGLQPGPFSGKVIADAIIRGDPGIDISPFAPDRWC